ncbi:MAG: FKBP-type peptidyl-prolyl cis-trans isomerase [Clostridia bacterium]|nr:FKBP-type peptidyl-prolyl cis-trans isomerase [Clostridia bacterium]
MKKIVSLLIVLGAVLALACGCGSVDVNKLNPFDYITLGDYKALSVAKMTEAYNAEREELASSYKSFNLDYGYTIEMNLVCEIVSGDETSTTYTKYDKYCYTGDKTLTLNIFDDTSDAYRATFDSALVYKFDQVGGDSTSEGKRTVTIGTAFDFIYTAPYIEGNAELSGKTLRFTVTPVKVLPPLFTDDDIGDTLDKFFEQYSADRTTAGVGDIITADITAKLDGEKLTAMSHKGRTFVLGCSEYAPGFDTALVGAEVGKTATFDVTYPADWTNENFAGKTVSFEVKLTSAVNYDKAVAANTGFDTLYELKEALRVENYAKQNMVNIIYSRSTLDTVPKNLYNEYYDHSMNSIKNDLKEQADRYTAAGTKTTVSDLITKYWGSQAKLEEYVSSLAKENVLSTLVCEALLDKLGIEYTEADYAKDLEANAKVYNDAYNTKYSAAEFEKMFNKNILRLVFVEEVINGVLMKQVNGYPLFDFEE